MGCKPTAEPRRCGAGPGESLALAFLEAGNEEDKGTLQILREGSVRNRVENRGETL